MLTSFVRAAGYPKNVGLCLGLRVFSFNSVKVPVKEVKKKEVWTFETSTFRRLWVQGELGFPGYLYKGDPLGIGGWGGMSLWAPPIPTPILPVWGGGRKNKRESSVSSVPAR